MLNFPNPPTQSNASVARRAALRETPLGEELRARASSAFEESTPGQVIEDSGLDKSELVPRTSLPDRPSLERSMRSHNLRDIQPERRRGFMKEDDYRASPFFREGVEWDRRMTPTRAEQLAEIVDKRNYRDSLFERSPGGFGRAAAGLGASLVGAAPDPINYMPILGPGARALATSRMGVIGGRAAVGTVEGALGAALLSPVIAENINSKGGNITSSDIALDIALSAVLGGAFGGVSGMFTARGERKRRATKALKADGAKRQVDALSKAVEDTLDGEPVSVEKIVGDDATKMRRRQTDTRIQDRLKRTAARIEGDRLAEEIELPSTSVLTRKGRQVNHTGPMDLVTFIRANQGLKESGGELKARDLTEKTTGRKDIQFVGREATYGKLVDNENGMTLDDAALKAWEAGYFPGKSERPTPDDLLDALDRTVAAEGDLDGRVFSESDFPVLDRLRVARDEADIQAENFDRQAGEIDAPRSNADEPDSDLDPVDDPAEVTLRGEADVDFSVEKQSDIDDIPFLSEAETSVQSRQSSDADGFDFDDVDDEALMLELDSMRAMGELSDEEMAFIDAANESFEMAEKYAEGFETLAGCVIRHG